MFQTEVVEEIKTHFCFQKLFPENRTVYEIMWKNIVVPAGHSWQYGACALRAEYLRPHTRNHIM